MKTPPMIAQTFVMKWEKDLGTSVTKTFKCELFKMNHSLVNVNKIYEKLEKMSMRTCMGEGSKWNFTTGT